MKKFLIFILVAMIAGATPVLSEYISNAITSDANKQEYTPLYFERVVDGDTFYASGKKIRVWGINAPEKGHRLYEIATEALKQFIQSGVLKCRQVDVDKYNRLVMQCLSEGSDIGALMVKVGFATDFTKYSGGYYHLEEELAREAGLGIWK